MNKNNKKILSPYELEEYANGGDFFNIMKAASPLVSLIPGVGTIAGPIMAGVGAIGGAVSNSITQQDQLDAQKQEQQKLAFNKNLDPRYLQGYEDGGSITEMPTTNAGVDSIPTDAQGNPASSSGREAIAMTDSGEVIWNGYVFSDKLGFSNKAKTVLKRYKLRLGDDFSGKDRISKEQMNRELSDLADEQELYKTNNNIKDSSEGYASGGGIHIKESNVGSFTSAATRRGMGVQEFANQVMSHKEKYSPEMVKKANFAVNSKSWNKLEGGGPVFKFDPFSVDKTMPSDDELNTLLQPQSSTVTSPKSINPDMFALVGNLATAGAQGLVAASAKQEDFTPTSYVPDKLNLSPERDSIERDAITSRRLLLNKYRNNKSAQIAGLASVNDQVASSMSRSYLGEEQYNTQANNTQRQFTAQSLDKQKELREMERGATASSTSAMIGNAGAAVNQYYTDRSKRAQEKSMLKIMEDGSQYLISTDESGRPVAFPIKPNNIK